METPRLVQVLRSESIWNSLSFLKNARMIV